MCSFVADGGVACRVVEKRCGSFSTRVGIFARTFKNDKEEAALSGLFACSGCARVNACECSVGCVTSQSSLKQPLSSRRDSAMC